jgi:hypothetical protein
MIERNYLTGVHPLHTTPPLYFTRYLPLRPLPPLLFTSAGPPVNLHSHHVGLVFALHFVCSDCLTVFMPTRTARVIRIYLPHGCTIAMSIVPYTTIPLETSKCALGGYTRVVCFVTPSQFELHRKKGYIYITILSVIKVPPAHDSVCSTDHDKNKVTLTWLSAP